MIESDTQLKVIQAHISLRLSEHMSIANHACSADRSQKSLG